LFTSEGCSSCPPADRILAQLQAQHTLDGAELLLLGEHVDYWNSAAWTDRFSKSSLTERQTNYAHALRLDSVYTPQVIVDGQFDVTGNDGGNLHRTIATAASQPKPAEVSLHWANPNQLDVQVDPRATASRVFFFVTEDDLTTQVKGGENGGITLHHAAVVRTFQVLSKKVSAPFADSVKISWNPEWQHSHLRFVVVVQQHDGAGPIIGAAAVGPPS